MKGKNAMVTIYDVAAHAGVSPKTVSRVLNQETTVRPKTRLMVEQAIQELGYIPSSAARIMRSNRSGIIGLITGAISRSTDNLRAHGLPDMFLVQGAQQAVVQSGKTLMIADTDNRLDNVEPLINTFMAHRAEGILYVAEKHQEVVLPSCPINCPVVLLNCFDQVGTPAILPDDHYGQYELVKRIIAAGHQRIAYLTLPQHVVATPLRVAGYRQALEEAGIAYRPEWVLEGYPDDHNSSQTLLQAIEQVLATQPRPTVLCCGNDEMAMRVYGMLRTRQLRVPEDISVAGYDNYRTIAETLFPPLTSMELPYTEMGKQAVKILLQLIEQGSLAKELFLVKGETIWRESVKPLNFE